MFEKLVVIEPVNMTQQAKDKLSDYAKEVILYEYMPADTAEKISRINNADAVLVSYTSTIDKEVILACPNLRYIGMCCSLYSPESANVDIFTAQKNGIDVYGIRDYGDPGVVEYVISELVRYLHGFGDKQWKDVPYEITGVKMGVLGLGITGKLIADAMQMLGADVSYYSRTRKPEEEAKGIGYLPLNTLLKEVDVVFCCLNKNVILLHEEEFAQLGNNKILFNTSIAPAFDIPALAGWLAEGSNEFFCDTALALGDNSLLASPHVNCIGMSSGGTTIQAIDRLSEKVLKNIEFFLNK